MRYLYAVLFLIITFSRVLSGAPVGLFLIEDVGALPSSLGGAFGAATGDVNCIKYNPSGLSEIRQYEFSFSHYMSFKNITHESLLLGIPIFQKDAAIGFNIDFVNYGELEETDNDGNVTGSFTARDSLINLTLSKKLSPNFMLGCNMKFFSSQLAGSKAESFISDIGGIYKYNNMRFGLTVQNFGRWCMDSVVMTCATAAK